MGADRFWVSRATLLLISLVACGASAGAQPGRTWVDPPSEVPAKPTPPAPPPQTSEPRESAPPAQAVVPKATTAPSRPPAPAVRSAEPRRSPAKPASPAIAAESRNPERSDAARTFAARYLNLWSAPNETALAATAEFYAPRVLYYGRTVDMRSLYDEKRRFVRRWPERDYRPRPDSMAVTCNSQNLCTVNTMFDFVAVNPMQGRRSEGAGALQLIVQFIDDRPVIVSENSTVLKERRARDFAPRGPFDE